MNSFEEIFTLRYNTLYYASAIIVLILVIEFYYKKNATGKLQNILLPILLLIIVFLFGSRGMEVGIDTPNNVKYFNGEVQIASISDVKDIGLYLVSVVSSNFFKSTDSFLTLLSILYILPIYIGIRNLKLNNPLIFFFILFSFFFFKNMGINTQRQGLAFSLFFCGVTYFIINKKYISYLLFGLSFLFHASFVLPITIFIIIKKSQTLYLPIIFYLTATILALINFPFDKVLSKIPYVNLFFEDRLAIYFDDIGNYQIGFRASFWFFNTVFAIVGIYTYKNLNKLNMDKQLYFRFLSSFLYLSGFFFLMFSARFSDRTGFLSWLFIPFLLYPFVTSYRNLGLLNIFSVFILLVSISTIFKFFL
ncbi:MAG: hypothetical protein CL524_12100 [Aequorivita sp.]|nr:hypothetical protein [Aequorivita sp.]MBF30641.1 hypothetical protein [Aequorivita sp.]|tara:strand:- start:36576 stop:37664 length:1089 start_codon:yes stop_codon:yes gene_type:complete